MSADAATLTDREFALLVRAADVLTRDTSFGRPEDSSDPGAGLRRALELRSDLVGPLRAVLDAVGDDDAMAVLTGLSTRDPVGWEALVASVFGGALTRADVRRAIGYPGQEGRVVRAEDFTRWAEAGLLDPVLERGPVWRRQP